MDSNWSVRSRSPLGSLERPSSAGHKNLFPNTRQGADIVGIDGERLFAKRVGRIRLLADRLGLKLARGALESQVLGVTIGRRRPFGGAGPPSASMS